MGKEASVSPVSAEQLLRLPIRLRGIHVGHAVDVILDPQGRCAPGIDVLCKDDAHRFLPLTETLHITADPRRVSAA